MAVTLSLLCGAVPYVSGGQVGREPVFKVVCEMVRGLSSHRPFINVLLQACPKDGGWTSIGDRCSLDDECNKTKLAVCYMGTCLCTPGYSYSHTRRTCNRRCLTYGTSMTPYPGLGISKHNTLTKWNTTSEDCISYCIDVAKFKCRSVDTYTDKRCHLQKLGYLDVRPMYRETGQKGWVLYQRDCSD